MNVTVRGTNVPVPSRLRNAAQRKLDRLERVARDASRAEVDFSEERNPRIRSATGAQSSCTGRASA